MSAQAVQQHLTRAGSKYADSAKKDIMGALSQFKDLRPGTDSYLFPNGKRRTAFTLKGTIPVYYKESCYNIPVCVYLWESHPYYAPICYVEPTATMVIKESEHVNKEGRVFLPYLNEWRFPGYDLSGVLQMMAMVFAEKCPVFAKSASSSASNAKSSTPQPNASSSSTPTPYPTAQPTGPTPYPSSAASTPYPTGSTPYPTMGTGYNPYMNVASNTPYPMGMPAAMPMPSASSGYPTPPPIPQLPSASSTGTIQSDTIRASLMSAIEDKLRTKLREKLGTNSAEMASIQATGHELREGQQKLKKALDELEIQRNNLMQVSQIYSEKRNELSKALAECVASDEAPIDEAIDAATPLHRQILLNYANDLTCDDIIYTLGQLLKSRHLTLSEYLRRVRDVSREQFIYRATMQKCRRVAGLPF